MRFSVGDKVRVINQSHGWGVVTKGDVGTVRTVNDSTYYVDFPTYYSWTGTDMCFELIESVAKEEPQFKVGDKVKPRPGRESNCWHGGSDDYEHTVITTIHSKNNIVYESFRESGESFGVCSCWDLSDFESYQVVWEVGDKLDIRNNQEFNSCSGISYNDVYIEIKSVSIQGDGTPYYSYDVRDKSGDYSGCCSGHTEVDWSSLKRWEPVKTVAEEPVEQEKTISAPTMTGTGSTIMSTSHTVVVDRAATLQDRAETVTPVPSYTAPSYSRSSSTARGKTMRKLFGRKSVRGRVEA